MKPGTGCAKDKSVKRPRMRVRLFTKKRVSSEEHSWNTKLKISQHAITVGVCTTGLSGSTTAAIVKNIFISVHHAH
jgi:hypothetical protein